MSAKQFGHFLNLHRQLAAIRRVSTRTTKTASRTGRDSTMTVAQAKDWLAETARGR